MRVAFAGTPEFAARTLSAILDAGFEVPLVLTAPDRPAGRGLAVRPSAVKQLALSRGIPVAQPATLKDAAQVTAVTSTQVDVLVVAAYGLILPAGVLGWPRHGAINVHASLLPRWRGAAPIQRALLAGDPKTGITLMQMDAGLDTGPMLDAVEVEIRPGDDAGSLHDRLAEAGAALLVRALRRLAREGVLPATPQPASGATYAAKIGRDDTIVDWRRTAVEIERQVRALAPAPGAVTGFRGEPLKIWRAELAGGSAASPGEVVDIGPARFDVACGDGVLRVREVQRAGGRRVDVASYLAGHPLRVGERLQGPDPD